MGSDRPNILLLMTDQQRWDSLGCYGSSFAHTPNLDRLASQGALFEHCYVNNPICTPSRASMMTGQHLPGHGVYRLYDNLPTDQVLFTKRLQDAGYHTALFGKLHVSSRTYEASHRHPHDGFDVYEWCLEPSIDMDAEHNGYSAWLKKKAPDFYERLYREGRKVLHVPREVHMTHWAAERTISYLDEASADRPFFCKMSVFDPHNPYEDYPLEMGELLDEAAIPDPFVVDGELDRAPHILKRLAKFTDGRAVHADAPKVREELRNIRFGYHASIALIDLEIGRVLDALERNGLAENTLVLFLSDHGDMLGDHQQMVKGAYFYDACTRVPLLLRLPGQRKPGLRVPALVQPHDVAATCLEAAGVDAEKIRAWMPDAKSLLPLASGEAESSHEYVVCMHRNSGLSQEGRGIYFDPPVHATMLRDARYKLVVYHGEGPDGGQLFDMQDDPGETRNLWNDTAHAQTRARLSLALCDWLAARETEACGSRGGESSPPWAKSRSVSR